MNKWWVYIIECRNNSLYTGISIDVDRRYNEHQYDNQKASRYCLSLRPLKLVYKSKPFKNKSSAAKEEYRIKKLHKREKIKLINSHENFKL